VPLPFTDAELRTKAMELGLIRPADPLPTAASVRSRIKAAIVEERRAAGRSEKQAEPVCAKEVVVQPGGQVLVDGEPFPWLIANVPMEIGLNPGGVSTVRMTLMAEAVQVPKPKQNPDQTESE
jgi:hypothetical protein